MVEPESSGADRRGRYDASHTVSRLAGQHSMHDVLELQWARRRAKHT